MQPTSELGNHTRQMSPRGATISPSVIPACLSPIVKRALNKEAVRIAIEKCCLWTLNFLTCWILQDSLCAWVSVSRPTVPVLSTCLDDVISPPKSPQHNENQDPPMCHVKLTTSVAAAKNCRSSMHHSCHARLVNIGIGIGTDRYVIGYTFAVSVSGAVPQILFWLIFADIRYWYNQKNLIFYLTHKMMLRSLRLPIRYTNWSTGSRAE